jgi:hypothetical protein
MAGGNRSKSGKTFQAHGMMRDVLVEICQDEEEFEHSVALLRIWRIGAFLEILDDGQRIG